MDKWINRPHELDRFVYVSATPPVSTPSPYAEIAPDSTLTDRHTSSPSAENNDTTSPFADNAADSAGSTPSSSYHSSDTEMVPIDNEPTAELHLHNSPVHTPSATNNSSHSITHQSHPQSRSPLSPSAGEQHQTLNPINTNAPPLIPPLSTGEQPSAFETRVLNELSTLLTTTNTILTTTNDHFTHLTNLETAVAAIRRRLSEAVVEFSNPPSSGRGDHDPSNTDAEQNNVATG